MWSPEPSPKTPILYRHWFSDGHFTFSPESYGLPSSQQLLTSDYLTHGHSSEQKEQNYVIIPLHSPPKKEQEKIVKPNPGTASRNSALSNFTPSLLLEKDGTQAHRRSPEKRFFSPGPICRICHDGDREQALLSPCNCNGSLQLVHKTCLERWLSTSNSDRCELCMKQLPVRKECRPLWQWFSMTSAADGPQGFYADLTCVILLTPLCLLSIYLCAIGAADYMKHGVWEGTGLAALSLFLLGTYIIWCYITVRFHLQTVKKWRNANQVIHLLEKDCRRRDRNSSKNSTSSTPRSSLVTSSRWQSPAEVQVVNPFGAGQQTGALEGTAVNSQNVMDASLHQLDVPAFL